MTSELFTLGLRTLIKLPNLGPKACIEAKGSHF